MVQVVLVQFKASTHKERGRPRDWRLGPMKVQQQRRDASHDTHCLHPKSFALGENDCKSPNDEKRLGRGFWTFCFGFGIR